MLDRFFGSAYDCDEAAAVWSVRNGDDLASLAGDEQVSGVMLQKQIGFYRWIVTVAHKWIMPQSIPCSNKVTPVPKASAIDRLKSLRVVLAQDCRCTHCKTNVPAAPNTGKAIRRRFFFTRARHSRASSTYL